MTEADESRPPALSCTSDAERRPLRRLRSTELFGRDNRLIIEHAGREYQLRITSNGKLILTA
jgi:hemin uptake protein HemP